MLQKNRGESEILEMKKTYKIRSWEFPRGHNERWGYNPHQDKVRYDAGVYHLKEKKNRKHEVHRQKRMGSGIGHFSFIMHFITEHRDSIR